MIQLLFFILGIVFAICLFNGKIDIRIHHIHEEVKPPISEDDLNEIVKQINNPDNEIDKIYEAMGDIKEVMEGSDRDV